MKLKINKKYIKGGYLA